MLTHNELMGKNVLASERMDSDKAKTWHVYVVLEASIGMLLILALSNDRK